MDIKFKVKNGVRTFERIYTNLTSATTALRDIIDEPPVKEYPDDAPIWNDLLKVYIKNGGVSKVMASASTNLVYGNDLFNKDTPDTAITAVKVIEFYFRFEPLENDEYKFSGDTLLCSLSAGIGDNRIEYSIGWDPTSTKDTIEEEEAENVIRSILTDYIDWAFKKMIHDMDKFIDEEQLEVMRTCYVRMFSKDIDKRVSDAISENSERYGLTRNGEEGNPDISKVLNSVLITDVKLTGDIVTKYPVKEFTAEFNDASGCPFCQHLVTLYGYKKSTDDESDVDIKTAVRVYDTEDQQYTEWIDVTDDRPIRVNGMGLNENLINEVLTPAVKTQLPSLAILQSAIITNTTEKLGSTPK